MTAAAAAGPGAAARDRCPRCGAGFRCGRDDAGPCPCAGVRLDAALQVALRARYSGCLCLGCLRLLATAGESGVEPGAREGC